MHVPFLGGWEGSEAALVRVLAVDTAVLAYHLTMYPGGIMSERLQRLIPSAPLDDDILQPHASAAGRAHPTVVLLHGFADNRSAFRVLRNSLLRHGWPRVQALNYPPFTDDIRSAAERLSPRIDSLCEQSGHRKVDIVAHSLGGLVARYYVQCLGGDARVRTLVTLGTPHAGTRSVPLLTPIPMIRQMRPGSPVIRRLAEPVRGCRTRFVSLWSDLDQFIIPVESARLDHPDLPTVNIKIAGVGHLALPVNATVSARIRQVLSTAGPLSRTADTG